jgi:polynucleotide 5'-hydroxyl-kinase GRC3/NOL9
MRQVLAPNNTLLIRGPAFIRLLNGDAEVLGGELRRNRELTIGRERQLAVEARTEAEFEIVLAKSGRTIEIEGSTIPESWRAAAEVMEEMNQGKVMVIGMTDVGKSTLCAYLVNRLLLRGLRLDIVDGDIGQSDIGPPTTVGASVPTTSVSSLLDLKADAIIFVGHTSPRQVQSKISGALKRLSDRRKDTLTIINTDGWVIDSDAISYKIRLINETKPDLVVALASESELQPILSGSRVQSVNVKTAKQVLTRSQSDRREIRRASYARFLEGARIRPIPLQEVTISTPRGSVQIDKLGTREANNLVVGLLNDEAYMLQIGILFGLTDLTAKVYCRSVENVRRIDVGYVKLSTKGTELGYFEPR